MKTWVLKNLFSLPDSQFCVGRNLADVPQCLALGQHIVSVSFIQQIIINGILLAPQHQNFAVYFRESIHIPIHMQKCITHTDRSVSNSLQSRIIFSQKMKMDNKLLELLKIFKKIIIKHLVNSENYLPVFPLDEIFIYLIVKVLC